MRHEGRISSWTKPHETGASTDIPARRASPELRELADQIETVAVDDLPVLAELVCRAGHEDHVRLLEEIELRHRLDAHAGRGVARILVLAGTAVVVATVLRVGWFVERPFLGFGLLGGLLLLRGLRGWYRASEVRQRLQLADASAATEEMVAAASDVASDRLPGRPRRRR
jgi:hypothetical protein